jgi:dolichol-phosphate mannosyltransferase
MSPVDPTYSIVIPIKEEEAALPKLVDRLLAVMARLDGPAEVIFVDDGSTDDSYKLISAITGGDDRFRAIRLSRNFGHQAALSAGLDAARGVAVVTMDGDLQHPPEAILEMAAQWRSGFEVVYGLSSGGRSQAMFKRTTSRAFYRVLRGTSNIEMVPGAGDFRLADRRVIDVVRLLPERNRYLRGLFSWAGFRQTSVPYECGPRVGGRTKYTAVRMMRLATDGIVGFSTLPLRLFLLMGFVVSALSVFCGVAAIAVKVANVFAVPGWASLVVVVSFLGGIQLFVLGVVGEYIGHIYDEVKRRPTYVVSDRSGFEITLPGRSPSDFASHSDADTL